MVKPFLSGKNCTVVAYGASGSGKTRTILGDSFKHCLQLDSNRVDQKDASNAPQKSPSRRSPLKVFAKAKRQGAKLPKQNAFSPDKAMISVTPKRNKELENLEEPSRADPKTMRLLEDLAVSSRRGLAPRMI